MKTASPPPGFTLIELLVVIGISLVLLGGALAGFLTFSDRQRAIGAVQELKTHFLTAQSKANSGDLGGCEQLTGYRIQTYLTGSVTELSLQAVCAVGTPNTAQVIAFSPGVLIDPNLDVTFLVLNGGVELPDAAASQEITVSSGASEYAFILYREGMASEGGWE